MLLCDFEEFDQGINPNDIFKAESLRTQLLLKMGVVNGVVVADDSEIAKEQDALQRATKRFVSFPSAYDIWVLLCNITTTIMVILKILYLLYKCTLKGKGKYWRRIPHQSIVAAISQSRRQDSEARDEVKTAITNENSVRPSNQQITSERKK